MKPQFLLKSVRFRRTAIPYLILLATFLFTGVAVYYVESRAKAEDQLRFDTAVQRTQNSIRDRLQTYIALLRAGSGLFAASDMVSKSEFQAFAERLELREQYPGIQGVGFSIRVNSSEVNALIAEMQRQGVEDFKIHPDFQRSEYHSILYLEPLDRRNQVAIGYDMFSEPMRRAAMEQARDTGEPAASGQVTLVQEIDLQKQSGFLIYLPVYEGDDIPSTVPERRSRLRGFIYSPFRVNDFIWGIFGNNQTSYVDFQIYDGTQIVPEHRLYCSNCSDDSTPDSYQPRFREVTTLDIAGRPWRIVFTSRPSLEKASERGLVPFIIVIGGIVGLMLFGVTRSQIHARIAAEQAAAESKRAEDLLRQSEMRYRMLIEQSPVSIQILSPDGKTIQVNRAWEDLWGLKLEQLQGYNLLADQQLVAKGIMPYIQQGFAGEVAAIPPALYDPNETLPGASTRENARRWVQAFIYPLKDKAGRIREVVLMHEDITEQQQAEEELRESEALFKTLIETTFDGIVIHDKGTILEANQGIAVMFGYSLPDFIGRSVLELAAEESRGVIRQNMLADVDAPYEAVGLRKDGTTFSLEIVGKPHVYKNRSVRVTALRDITERKQLEAQLRARAEQLAEANRLKDEFLATLSHELRTPLNAMLGWAQMLATRQLEKATFDRATEAIYRNTRSLAQLIEDLLDVSRIITGKLHLNRHPTPLVPVIEAAIETVRSTAEAKAIDLRFAIDSAGSENASFLVSGDANRLQQVIWNLLSNAVKFTPSGGRVEVRLERGDRGDGGDREVTSSPSSSPIYAQITVTDTGQGIDNTFLPYVFERFRQADGSTTRAHGGLGLGLAIVRHLVELHRGTVQVTSPGLGQGATFSVKLPLLSGQAAVGQTGLPQSAISPAARSPASISLAGLRVLIVDDEADAREMLCVILQDYRAEAIAVASAREVLDQLRQFKPHVLVSDIAMPEEDGFALIHNVRALDPAEGGNIPAIALTAYARAEDRRATALAGFQVHLAKPVEPSQLVAAIAHLAKR